jgi:phosphomethylpyrimidine synthase
MTVHCGVTQSAINWLKKRRRVADVVSRGGAFLIGWMLYNKCENPLYEYYDRLLEIAARYDVTLSLGVIINLFSALIGTKVIFDWINFKKQLKTLSI